MRNPAGLDAELRACVSASFSAGRGQPMATAPQLWSDLVFSRAGGFMGRFRAVRLVAFLFVAVLSAAQERAAGKAVLWQDPGDIRALNLYWGPGGEKHQPQMPLEFEKEDMRGTSPKFDLRDA